MMTKKNYEAIADMFQEARLSAIELNSGNALSAVYGLALDMSDYFKADNPRFDTKRFLTACGF